MKFFGFTARFGREKNYRKQFKIQYDKIGFFSQKHLETTCHQNKSI